MFSYKQFQLETPEKHMKISPIWQSGIKRMRNIIDSTKTDVEKLQEVQKTELFSVCTTDREEQLLSAAKWEEVILKRFGKSYETFKHLSESELHPASLSFQYNGRLVSQDFYKKLNIALEVGHNFPRLIMELGGGVGQQARILFNINPSCKYILIDLPETLHFAEIYLKEHFPSKKIVKPTAGSDFGKEYDIMLVPSTMFPAYAFWWSYEPEGSRPDMFINTSSLGEMDSETQGMYVNIIQTKIKPKRCVLLNRLLNTYSPITERFRENEAGWYWMLDRNWRVYRWELEPDFTLIPFTEMFHNREVFIVADRMFSKESLLNIDNIKAQYWYKNFSLRATDRWANQLSIDHDVLKRLSESVRMLPSVENVDMLIKYLYTIKKQYPFEEEQYLFKLYQSLAMKPHPLACKWTKRVWTKAMSIISNTIKDYIPERIKQPLRQFAQ